MVSWPQVLAWTGVQSTQLCHGGLGLYSINQSNGSLSFIGNSSISYNAFGSTATGLYMLDTTGSLWNINSSTGSATRIGSTLIDVIAGAPLGLSAGANNLYVAMGSNIYSVNTATAASTLIGTTPTTAFGALVQVDGSLYGSSIINARQIYNFNPTTGISTFVTELRLWRLQLWFGARSFPSRVHSCCSASPVCWLAATL